MNEATSATDRVSSGSACRPPVHAPAGDRNRAPRSGRLWDLPFSTYWGSTSVSNLGSGVTLIALPVLAARQLGADAAQLGYLRALEVAPYVLFALVIGQLVDRSRPLPLMIIADLSRALLFIAAFALAVSSLLGIDSSNSGRFRQW